VTSVKTSSPFDPGLVLSQFKALSARAGFRIEPFGEISGHPLIGLTKRTPGPRPRIYLSAGIHGDEPAPPLALLRLLEQGFFDQRANWFICPMLNPTGLALGTRENAGKVDLNRDYRNTQSVEIAAHIRWLERQPAFDLSFCVHEDWEATGYYLYELNPDQRPTLAEPMIAAVAKRCLIEPSEMIDGREARAGIVRPEHDPATRDLWPEAIYLRKHHTTLAYTIESPSSLPLEQRIHAHCAALAAGIALSVEQRVAVDTQFIAAKRS
jgi:hypothetical protein